MTLKRRRAQRKVDYAASIEDRKRLAAYMNKGNFNRIAGKKKFSSGEKWMQAILCTLGSSLILTGLYFVFF